MITIHPTEELIFLTQEDVIACGGSDMPAAMLDVHEGFRLYGLGHTRLPHKTTLKASDDESTGSGIVNILPCYINRGGTEIFACKALGSMPSNVARNLPRANGLITLFDGHTKAPVCIMDGAVISATRTGAVSGVGAPFLVDPAIDEIGLIGAGINMRTQLTALHRALPKLQNVKVYSRGQSKYMFAQEMGQRLGLNIVPVETARNAVTNLPLVVTCVARTSEPVVDRSWIAPGATVFTIGAYEIDPAALPGMDRIIVDSWEHCRHRGGRTDIRAVELGLIREDKIENLTPILTGQQPGRQTPRESIYFAPVGMGFLDGLIAWRVYQAALKNNHGATLKLRSNPSWI